MSYYKKYKKYVEKIAQIGGHIPLIEELDENFLDGWRKITNYGQQNCGIFMNDIYIDKLIKCGKSYDYSKLDELNSQPLLIFPKIHTVHIFNSNHYIKMDKLDGDLTQLIFETLLRESISELALDPIYYDIFHLKIPKTMNSRIVILDNLLEVNVALDDELKTNILKFMRENPAIEFNNTKIHIIGKNELQSNINGDSYTLYIYPKCVDSYNEKFNIIKSSIEYYQYLHTHINHTDYIRLFNLFETKFNNIVPEILKIILKLKNKLLEQNLKYEDNKFDNFGYKIIEEDMSDGFTFMYNGKYFRIYILDWVATSSIKLDIS